MPSAESNPTIYVCSEDKDAFVPVPSSVLMLNLADDRDKIDSLLEKLPEIFNPE